MQGHLASALQCRGEQKICNRRCPWVGWRFVCELHGQAVMQGGESCRVTFPQRTACAACVEAFLTTVKKCDAPLQALSFRYMLLAMLIRMIFGPESDMSRRPRVILCSCRVLAL